MVFNARRGVFESGWAQALRCRVKCRVPRSNTPETIGYLDSPGSLRCSATSPRWSGSSQALKGRVEGCAAPSGLDEITTRTRDHGSLRWAIALLRVADENIAAILPSYGSLARKILNFRQGRFLKSSSIAKAHGSITKIFHVPLENLRSDPRCTVPFVLSAYRSAL